MTRGELSQSRRGSWGRARPRCYDRRDGRPSSRPRRSSSLTPARGGEDQGAHGRGARGRRSASCASRSRAAAAPASSTASASTRGAAEGDESIEQHGVTVVVDPFSAPYLKGATDRLPRLGLQESGFKIDNPNAAASCGCGHSFQVEEGAEAAPDAHAPAAAAPAARTRRVPHLLLRPARPSVARSAPARIILASVDR